MALVLGTAPAAHAAAPEVLAYPATGVTSSGATISGYISLNRGLNIRQCGLQYRPSGSSSWTTCYTKYPANANDRSIGPYTLNGLASGTTYYYRAYAINVNGEPGYSSGRDYFTTAVRYTLDLSSSSWSAGSGASYLTVSVTSNTTWSAPASNVSWLTVTNVSPSSRTGNGSFRINAAANTGAARTGTVTVSVSGITRTVTVNQAAGFTLDLSPSDFYLGSAASSFTVNVISNTIWSLPVSSDTSWLTVTNVNPASRIGNGSFKFTAAANTGAARTAKITVTGGGFTRSISINQAAAPVAVDANKIYKLRNAASGRYLNVAGGYGGENGINVIQKASDNSEMAQEFRVIYDSAKSAYRIYPICSKNGRYRVLDIVKSNNAVLNGCNVQTYRPNDDVAQLFRIEGVGSGRYKITSNSNTAVALAANGTGDGSETGTSSGSAGNVFMQTYTGAGNQLWYLEEFPDRHEEHYAALGFSYPLTASRISDGYGYRIHPTSRERQFHGGTDIPAAEGTLLRAPFDGTVVKIGNDEKSMGNFIILEADAKNAYGTATKVRAVYMHMFEEPNKTNPAVVERAKVTTSTVIGKVGKTGKGVTGAHLHLTMITDGSERVTSINTTNNPQMYYSSSTFTYE
ncbi:MAG: RICIN domain-containing protein [Clostridiales Family XIII bacterium]|nr:RICIN domain-containing protein [Clostridiales Family XIII bacterium]